MNKVETETPVCRGQNPEVGPLLATNRPATRMAAADRQDTGPYRNEQGPVDGVGPVRSLQRHSLVTPWSSSRRPPAFDQFQSVSNNVISHLKLFICKLPAISTALSSVINHHETFALKTGIFSHRYLHDPF